MKIKGLRSVVEQVTFEGDTHPTTGVVSTFTWGELAKHLELRNNDKVISFRVGPDGLTVYWKDGSVLGRATKL